MSKCQGGRTRCNYNGELCSDGHCASYCEDVEQCCGHTTCSCVCHVGLGCALDYKAPDIYEEESARSESKGLKGQVRDLVRRVEELEYEIYRMVETEDCAGGCSKAVEQCCRHTTPSCKDDAHCYEPIELCKHCGDEKAHTCPSVPYAPYYPTWVIPYGPYPYSTPIYGTGAGNISPGTTTTGNTCQ